MPMIYMRKYTPENKTKRALQKSSITKPAKFYLVDAF